MSKSGRISAVFFAMDGTLVDSETLALPTVYPQLGGKANIAARLQALFHDLLPEERPELEYYLPVLRRCLSAKS